MFNQKKYMETEFVINNFIRNGWVKKGGIFLSKKGLPLTISISRVDITVNVHNPIEAIMITVINKKPINWEKHMIKLLDDIKTMKYYPIEDLNCELGYFVEETIPNTDIFLHKCFIVNPYCKNRKKVIKEIDKPMEMINTLVHIK